MRWATSSFSVEPTDRLPIGIAMFIGKCAGGSPIVNSGLGRKISLAMLVLLCAPHSRRHSRWQVFSGMRYSNGPAESAGNRRCWRNGNSQVGCYCAPAGVEAGVLGSWSWRRQYDFPSRFCFIRLGSGGRFGNGSGHGAGADGRAGSRCSRCVDSGGGAGRHSASAGACCSGFERHAARKRWLCPELAKPGARSSTVGGSAVTIRPQSRIDPGDWGWHSCVGRHLSQAASR